MYKNRVIYFLLSITNETIALTIKNIKNDIVMLQMIELMNYDTGVDG